MKKSLKLFLILFSVSILTLGVVFLGFYIFYTITHDYGSIAPYKESQSVLYPSQNENTQGVSQEDPQSEEATSTEIEIDNTNKSVLNTKSNLTLQNIKNTFYDIWGEKEAKFVEGVFRVGSIEPRSSTFIDSSITTYAFGDVTNDGNGDAVVVTSTSLGNSPLDELHIVINKNSVPKSFKASPLLGEGFDVRNYSAVSIRNGRITLAMDVLAPGDARCCPSLKKTLIYKLVGQNLVEVRDEIVWKKYSDKKFGFEFTYPGNIKPVVKPIFLEGKEVYDSLHIVLPFKFENEYNTWTEKEIDISILKKSCPFRQDSSVIVRNNIDFHFFDISEEMSRTNDFISKQEEYIASKVGYCFVIKSGLSGPGINSKEYPKSSLIKSPEDVNNFFDQEFIILNQVLDTFKFI